jgi:hypothetical protein
MSNVQPPIPNPVELNLPGGTYTATQTFVQVDKAGQWFATSMSSYGVPDKQFGIHLWYRKSINAPWELIQFSDGAHGNITVIGNELYFIVNRMNKTAFMNKISRWQGVRS